MQSGAFLQLILTLVAITSRMDVLVIELQEILSLIWDVAHLVLETINPGDARKHTSKGISHPAVSATVQKRTISLETDIALYEDMGTSLNRQNNGEGTCHLPAVEPQQVEQDTTGDESTVQSHSFSAVDVGPTRVVVERKVVAVAKRSSYSGQEIGSKRQKKKRKQADEIDAIFG